MKPRDTYRSSYLKAQRCFCVLAASKMLKALLSAPYNGVPLFVLKNIPFDWQSVVFTLQCTLHFAKPPRASQWPKSSCWWGQRVTGFLSLSCCCFLCSCCRLPLECVKQPVLGCSGNCSVLAWGETIAHFLGRGLKPWPGQNVSHSYCARDQPLGSSKVRFMKKQSW